MSSIMASDQSKLLLEHYLSFQRRLERTVTLKDFAAHLEIHETTLNLLINDKRSMSGKMAVHLASKTGDHRFLDLKQLPHPDPLFSYVSMEWPHLNAEQQRAVRDQIAKYRAGENDERERTTVPARV